MLARIIQKVLVEPLKTKSLSPTVLPAYTQGTYDNSSFVNQPDDTKDLLETFTVHPWVYVSIWDICSSASGLSYNIFMKTNNGKEERVLESNLVSLLNRPNKWMSHADLWEAHFIAMETAGMAFWELKTDNNRPISSLNPPKEIYFLRPDRIKIIKDRKNYIGGYVYNINGKDIPFRVDQIIFFRYWNPVDDYNGLSAIKPAKLSIQTDLFAMSWNSKFFENGAIPEGVFASDGSKNLTEIQRRRLKQELFDAHSNPTNWRKPLVVEGLKWVERQKSQQDMEFLNLRKMTRDEIFATTGETKLYAGLSEQINRATAEVEERLFWQKTMKPKLAKLESALNMHLLPLFGNGLVGRHDLSQVEALQPNVQVWVDVMNRATGGRQVLSQNEARTLLGEKLNRTYPAFEGGDEIYDNLSMVPIGTIPKKNKEFDGIFVKKKGKPISKLEQSFGSDLSEELNQESKSFYEFYKDILQSKNGKSLKISKMKQNGLSMQ